VVQVKVRADRLQVGCRRVALGGPAVQAVQAVQEDSRAWTGPRR